MEFVNGTNLVDALRKRFKRYADACGQTVDEFMEEQRRLLEHPKSLAQVEFENRFYSVLELARDVVRNTLFAFLNLLPGVSRRPIEWHSPPVNLARIVRHLNEIEAFGVCVAGVFHG